MEAKCKKHGKEVRTVQNHGWEKPSITIIYKCRCWNYMSNQEELEKINHNIPKSATWWHASLPSSVNIKDYDKGKIPVQSNPFELSAELRILTGKELYEKGLRAGENRFDPPIVPL